MKFSDLGLGDKFVFPDGIELGKFGPLCPHHPRDGKKCTFTKTQTGDPPRTYFGASKFRNAKRDCDGSEYDFSSVWTEVTKVD